jgi:PAS domain S-box-containing protein
VDAVKKPSEERYRAMLETSADATALVAVDGRLLFVSDPIERLTGYSPDELIGRSAFELVHPDDLRHVHEAFRRVVLSSEPVRIEYRGRHKDGSWRQRDVIGINRLNDPAVAAVVVNFRDNSVCSAVETALRTERTQLEQKLAHTQKMEAVGRLAGGIAHDFNNLLMAIVGYAELTLAELKADDPLRRDIEEIRVAGQSAASLTRQLLAFSRKQLLQPQILDINAVVSRMTGLLRRLIGEHIDLQSRPAQPLGRVSADPGQIEQVIVNLAVNARDAMPSGGTLTIETANVELDQSYVADHPGSITGPHVMLAITDTGVGMPPAVQEHLFEPFYTTKEPGKGTGLGLATVYGIVKQSGGSIAVFSEAAHGTSVKIFLPAVESAIDPSRELDAIGPDLHGTETILLVEDEPEVRSVVKQMLARHGYGVLEAGDGAKALLIARSYPGRIDLLLTDVVMPGMSGREVATEFLRERPDACAIYMSGYTDDTVVQQGVIERGVPFIQKPFTPTTLLQRIRDVLRSPTPGLDLHNRRD